MLFTHRTHEILIKQKPAFIDSLYFLNCIFIKIYIFYSFVIQLSEITHYRMVNYGLGVPVKVLHEAEGHVVTVEASTGELYRGTLIEAEDNMNLQV